MKHQLPIRPFLRLLLIAFLFKLTIPIHAQAPNGGFSDFTQGTSGYGTAGYGAVSVVGSPSGGFDFGIPFSGAQSSPIGNGLKYPPVVSVGDKSSLPSANCGIYLSDADLFRMEYQFRLFGKDQSYYELTEENFEEMREECFFDAQKEFNQCKLKVSSKYVLEFDKCLQRDDASTTQVTVGFPEILTISSGLNSPEYCRSYVDLRSNAENASCQTDFDNFQTDCRNIR